MFCCDGTEFVSDVGVLLAKPINDTSVLSAFLIVSLAAACGTNVREHLDINWQIWKGLTGLAEVMLSQDYLRDVCERRDGGEVGRRGNSVDNTGIEEP